MFLVLLFVWYEVLFKMGFHKGLRREVEVWVDVSIYAYSGVVRFITDYVTGGHIFALFDRLYQSTNFFLNLLSYMLTLLNHHYRCSEPDRQAVRRIIYVVVLSSCRRVTTGDSRTADGTLMTGALVTKHMRVKYTGVHFY